MTDPKYKAFTPLNPFFDIVLQGLAGQVDADHFLATTSCCTAQTRFSCIDPRILVS